MQRFLPTITFEDVMKNISNPGSFGYNSTFLYSPTTGIQGVLTALLSGKNVKYALNEEVLQIDTVNKTVLTDKRRITYKTLINTLPLSIFNKLTVQQDTSLELHSVDVDVYNITYTTDCSNIKNASWTYFPDKEVPFYRVGFYNQIVESEKTSVYVEVSKKTGDTTKYTLHEISEILKKINVIKSSAEMQESQHLTMSPAYVIFDTNTEKEVIDYCELLKCFDIHMLGRYGNWTYSSIEDDIIKAQQLAIKLLNTTNIN